MKLNAQLGGTSLTCAYKQYILPEFLFVLETLIYSSAYHAV
jgi:hypothetical protein